VYPVGFEKRGFSAKRLCKMIDGSYPTVCLIIHKVRKAMKDRDTLYKLNQFIEMDDSFFGGRLAGKRGRGASNKSKGVVAVENREKHAGYATMQVVDHIESDNLNGFIYRSIELSAVAWIIFPIVSAEYFEPKNAVPFVFENRILHVVQ